jgi:hypothetical protein
MSDKVGNDPNGNDPNGFIDMLLDDGPGSVEVTFTERGGVIATGFRGGGADPKNIVGGYVGHVPLGKAWRLSIALMVAPERSVEILKKLAELQSMHPPDDPPYDSGIHDGAVEDPGRPLGMPKKPEDA